jgi:hypothetical protein
MIDSFGNRQLQPNSSRAPCLHSHRCDSMQQGLSVFMGPGICACRCPADSPFANFPPEIVCFIVKHAASASPRTALTLTLVSKTVRAWVEPTLYRTVTLWTSDTVDLFRVAFDAKPPSFFATHVRHLFINGEHGSDIILACSRVERVAVYPPALEGLPELDIQEEDAAASAAGLSAALQNISDTECPTPYEVMLMGTLEDVPWASPLFRNVKYLYLGLEPPPPATACDVSLLPSLTHCAFPYDGDEEDELILTISTLLESSTLKHLLVLVNDEQGNPDPDRKGSIWVKLACVADDRLLVGTEYMFDGDDWKAMVEDGISVWDYWERDCSGWRSWRSGLP